MPILSCNSRRLGASGANPGDLSPSRVSEAIPTRCQTQVQRGVALLAGLLAAWRAIRAHFRLAAPLGAPHRSSPAVCDAHPGQPLGLRSVSSLAMLSKSSLCGYVEEKRSHTLRAVTLTATATFRILLRIVPLWARASGLPASP